MSKYKLKIELLSDMCVSDGGVYNSSVDIDICYDIYGFPYIPAKRIRGCLRECAIELSDWNVDIKWQKMFGEEGSSAKRAAIRISDAHLEEFEKMKALAEENTGKTVFHPQNILNHFTYTRTQTAINYETGVADRTSLRTMRVANKGLIFIAKVDMGPEYKEELESCCAIFHNIGVSRTRGIGEIQVTLEPYDSEQAKINHAPYIEGTEILEYQLFLEEPVICKSVNGGEARTLDYIEGSKMQGLLIENADSREKFFEVMSCDELFCSNAYISKEHIRYTEVPAFIYSVKNDSTHYVNKLYPDPSCVKEEGLQLNAMKHCYVSVGEGQKLNRASVKIEERYHHRRPEDKAVGRAAEEESGNSQFYQMSSIEAGQSFQGYFAGNAEQMKAVYDILSKKEIYYIGYSRTSEYGKVRLQITGMKKKEIPVRVKAKSFYVKLEAPAIIYNKNAFYSTNPQDLIDEINAVLGISREIPSEHLNTRKIRRYVRYTTTGGYNTTWKCPKPTITAFDKGTVLLYQLEEASELTIPPVFLVGERVSEGYGEASIQILDNMEEPLELLEISEAQGIETKGCVDATPMFVSAICKDLFEDYVRLAAAQDAKKSGIGLEARPTVSNMLLLSQENQKFDQIKRACEKRYGKNTDNKQDKLQYANEILKEVNANTKEILEEFCRIYQIQNFEFSENEQKMIYLEHFLKQLKYNFRQTEREVGKIE